MRRSRSAAVTRSVVILGSARPGRGLFSQCRPRDHDHDNHDVDLDDARTDDIDDEHLFHDDYDDHRRRPPVAPCTAGQLKVVAQEGTGAAGSIFSPVNVSEHLDNGLHARRQARHHA